MNDNIVTLVQKEEEAKGYIQLTMMGGDRYYLQVDSFGEIENIPGFIMFFREDAQSPLGVINKSEIKSIYILTETPNPQEVSDFSMVI